MLSGVESTAAEAMARQAIPVKPGGHGARPAVGHDFPHPGLNSTLTRPAATLSHSMGERLRGRIVRHPLENLSAGICQTAIRQTKTRQQLFPLLGERLKGEGGRQNKITGATIG